MATRLETVAPPPFRPRTFARRPATRGVRTLMVGTGPRAARCARTLIEQTPGRVFVGVLDSESLPDLGREVPEMQWLGGVGDLRSVVHRTGVQEVFVALPVRSRYDDLVEVVRVGRELGLPVSFDLDLFERASTPRVDHDTLRVRCNLHRSSRMPWRFLKRAIDVVGAVVALVLLAPVLVVAALAVRFSSPGAVLFRQVRIGRGGVPFRMLKFRTMVQDAEAIRPKIAALNDGKNGSFKIVRDPRVTRVGRFLRRTSIDELPQLLNVLGGSMSLVGPRPIPNWVAETLREPTYHRRLSVLPGLTGLWQVVSRRQDFEHMAGLDLEYVDRWSIALDLRLLVGTLPAIIGGKNAF